jgi:hypothetical protein
MALSPNYGWAEPDNSSLVKNGAQDIRALGDAIDTSLWNVGFGQAGKNRIINGDMNIWQRGTSYSAGGFGIYGAMDRFRVSSTGGTSTVSQQAFTAGTAPVAGYEGQFFARVATAASAMTYWDFGQPIEDVRTFAGQTMTVSFWAKSSAATTILIRARQDFGSGGSTAVNNDSTPFALTTSWARYSATIAVPSISGKTIGTGSNLGIYAQYSSGTINGLSLDFWGFQAEYGSKATPFETATGTIQGELSACQRYYWRSTATGAYSWFGQGFGISTSNIIYPIQNPVPMRTAPTSIDTSTTISYDGGFTGAGTLTIQANESSTLITRISYAGSGFTTNRPYALLANNSTSAYVGASAEL